MSLPAYEKLGAFYLGREVDPTSGADRDAPVMYDARDLTTHAVCVGMTGSGKTGLCVTLLEEAALDGVPALVIDPKGDLSNLLLTFPQLRAEDFEPWIDPADAARKNRSVAEHAQATADSWRRGLADWDQDGERIGRLRDAAEVALYTPGSRAGRPLSMLGAFTAPDADTLDDSGALKERIGAAVASLLGLIGIAADPLKSREHILLASLLDHAWRRGDSPDLADLIGRIQKPPFDRVGVFDVDTFYPPKDRLELAMAINHLLASPGFDAWLEGDALDLQHLLFSPEGKPRIAIVSIAHLNDAERMFVVTLLLNEAVGWMRKQGGTSSLRAILYMDEIFGYFPPSAMPPSKTPLLTLMKQARAFGLGVVLATQNPVDLDYKGLSNAGTWFIGRLQTERDQARVIEGLLGADGGTDRQALERLMAGLGNRVFLMRNVHDDAPLLLRTRWALSYLRGPLTLAEIRRLGQSLPAAPAQVARPTPSTKAAAKPVIPAGVDEQYLSGPGTTWAAHLLGSVRTHFVHAASGVDVWQTRSWLAPIRDQDDAPDWAAAQDAEPLKPRLGAQPEGDLAWAEAPAALSREQNYARWSKQLADHAYRHLTLDLLRCPTLKLASKPGETEGDFRARIAHALHERRDAAIDTLRNRYAARITTLIDQLRRAEERIAREQSQLSQQKMHTAISVGSALLGAILGRRAISSGNVGRVGSAARNAGRISRESDDVRRASESAEVLQRRLADLQTELERETAQLRQDLDPSAAPIEKTPIRPRKTDTTTIGLDVVWVPA